MQRKLIFAPEAADDLDRLYDCVADRAGAGRAFAYVMRIEAACAGLAIFPKRGIRRDDVRAGLRIVGFERRVAIAFHITPDLIVIDRVLYGGRDVSSAFQK